MRWNWCKFHKTVLMLKNKPIFMERAGLSSYRQWGKEYCKIVVIVDTAGVHRYSEADKSCRRVAYR